MQMRCFKWGAGARPFLGGCPDRAFWSQILVTPFVTKLVGDTVCKKWLFYYIKKKMLMARGCLPVFSLSWVTVCVWMELRGWHACSYWFLMCYVTRNIFWYLIYYLGQHCAYSQKSLKMHSVVFIVSAFSSGKSVFNQLHLWGWLSEFLFSQNKTSKQWKKLEPPSSLLLSTNTYCCLSWK